MAADHLEFLKDKFMTDFHEAGDEFGGKLPLRSHFLQVVEVLQEMTINDSTPIQTKNCLYDLRYLLEECVLSAEKERQLELLVQNKKSRSKIGTLKKFWFIHKIGNKLKKIKEKLEEINKDEVGEASLRRESISVQLSEDIPSLVESEIHGFDAQLKKVETLLFGTPDDDDDDGIKAIGIVGMSGVGKTTLARLILRKCRLGRVFSPIIWITVSGKANPPVIVRHLLTRLGAKYDFPDLDAQVTELHNRLFGRKYLIVLDNVCHLDKWYSDLGSNEYEDDDMSHFRHGLPKGGGGAIIVTTIFEEIATSMVGEKNLLTLHPTFKAEGMVGEKNLLTPDPTFKAEEIRSIFNDSIGRKEFLDQEHKQKLSEMEEEIIDRCDGLPLAAKTLAEIISIQLAEEEYWSDSHVRKEFWLKVDQPDHLSYWKAREKLTTLRGVEVVSNGQGGDKINSAGVDDISNGQGGDKIKIVGKCHVIEIVRELGKFWHTELISVKAAQGQNDISEENRTEEHETKQEEFNKKVKDGQGCWPSFTSLRLNKQGEKKKKESH